MCSNRKHYPDSFKKIAIVDWDVHHGNGTQDLVYSDPDTLFFSIHRFGNGFYPSTGKSSDVGDARVPASLGKIINVPLMCKAVGEKHYLQVWEAVLLPVLREFKPDVIFVSAGFDCAKGDPLGGMEVLPEGFAHLMRALMAEDVCEVFCSFFLFFLLFLGLFFYILLFAALCLSLLL